MADVPELNSLVSEIISQPNTITNEPTDNTVKELVNSANDIHELDDKLSILAADENSKNIPNLQQVQDMIQNGDSLESINAAILKNT
jgi:hypothetical protein